MEFLSLLALAGTVCPVACLLTSSLGALGSFMLVYNGLISILTRLRDDTGNAEVESELKTHNEGTGETISVGAVMLGASLFVLLLEKNISVFQPVAWLTCVILFAAFAVRAAFVTRPQNI